jgi:thiol peroxidase
MYLSFSRLFGLMLSILGCTSADSQLLINSDHIAPGSRVLAAGKEVPLHPGQLSLGEAFAPRAESLAFDPAERVTFINIVPTLDTSVCEAQTLLLGESLTLHPAIRRVVISRDLPQAQERFERETGLVNIDYFSDYKEGTFGRSTGLMMQGTELLTRGILVLDHKGYVRYMQLVSKLEELPDMEKAILFANGLVP